MQTQTQTLKLQGQGQGQPATPQRTISKKTGQIVVPPASPPTLTGVNITNVDDPSPGRIHRLLKRAAVRISTPQLLEKKRRRFEEKQALMHVGGIGGRKEGGRVEGEGEKGAAREFNFGTTEITLETIEIQGQEKGQLQTEKTEKSKRLKLEELKISSHEKKKIFSVNENVWPLDFQLRSRITFRSPFPFAWLERAQGIATGLSNLLVHPTPTSQSSSSVWKSVAPSGSVSVALSSNAKFLYDNTNDDSALITLMNEESDEHRLLSLLLTDKDNIQNQEVNLHSLETDFLGTASLFDATKYYSYPETQWPQGVLSHTALACERLYTQVVSQLRDLEIEKSKLQTIATTRQKQKQGHITTKVSSSSSKSSSRGHSSHSQSVKPSSSSSSSSANVKPESVKIKRVFVSASTIAARVVSGLGIGRSSSSSSFLGKKGTSAVEIAKNMKIGGGKDVTTKVNEGEEDSKKTSHTKGSSSSSHKNQSSSSSKHIHTNTTNSKAKVDPFVESSSNLDSKASHVTNEKDLSTTLASVTSSQTQTLQSTSLLSTLLSTSFPTVIPPPLPEWLVNFRKTTVEVGLSEGLGREASTTSSSFLQGSLSLVPKEEVKSYIISSEPQDLLLPPPQQQQPLPLPPQTKRIRASSSSSSGLVKSNEETDHKDSSSLSVLSNTHSSQLILGVPRDSYARILPYLQASANRQGETEAISLWLDRVIKFQQALASAWASLLLATSSLSAVSSRLQEQIKGMSSSSQSIVRQRQQRQKREGGRGGGRSRSNKLPFFMIRFGPQKSNAGNVILFGRSDVLLEKKTSTNEHDKVSHSHSGTRSGNTRLGVQSITQDMTSIPIALIARSSASLRQRLDLAGLVYSTPLDPTLPLFDKKVSAAIVSEMDEMSRYAKNVELSGGIGVTVSTEVLSMMTMSLGGPVNKPVSNTRPETDDDDNNNEEEDDDEGMILEKNDDQQGKDIHISNGINCVGYTPATLQAVSLSSDTIRGSPETLTSLLLITGASNCALLAQLIAESVSPGSLSPSSLLYTPTSIVSNTTTSSGIGASTSSTSSSSFSFIPPRPRLPLSLISLIGCGMGVNANVGRQGAEASLGLDVPQIISPMSFQSNPSSAIEILSPFKHASVSSLDLFVRSVHEQVEGSQSTRDTVEVFDLDIRGPILPFAVERISKLVTGLQIREACLLQKETSMSMREVLKPRRNAKDQTLQQPFIQKHIYERKGKQEIIALSMKSIVHLATTAFSGNVSNIYDSEIAPNTGSLLDSILLALSTSKEVEEEEEEEGRRRGRGEEGIVTTSQTRDWQDISDLEAHVSIEYINDLKSKLVGQDDSYVEIETAEIEIRQKIQQGNPTYFISSNNNNIRDDVVAEITFRKT
jgi:hypothetical protein